MIQYATPAAPQDRSGILTLLHVRDDILLYATLQGLYFIVYRPAGPIFCPMPPCRADILSYAALIIQNMLPTFD